MPGGLEEALGTLYLLELAGQTSPKKNFTVNHTYATGSVYSLMVCLAVLALGKISRNNILVSKLPVQLASSDVW